MCPWILNTLQWTIWLGDKYFVHGSLIVSRFYLQRVGIPLISNDSTGIRNSAWWPVCRSKVIRLHTVNIGMNIIPSIISILIFNTLTRGKYPWPSDFAWSSLYFAYDRVRKLLKLAESVTPTMYIARPSLESFVCDRARIGVVGEAAHPMMVCSLYCICVRHKRVFFCSQMDFTMQQWP